MTTTATESCEEYRRARENFFHQHGAQFPGTLADAFDILAPCTLTQADVDEILTAASALAQIFSRAADIVRALTNDALLEMGVPAHILPAVRYAVAGVADCVIGRFDLARTPFGYKLLELNADVPALLVEAFSLNAAVCREAGRADPNAACEEQVRAALVDAVMTSARYITNGRPNVVVTFIGDYARDRALASYVRDLLGEASALSWPIESLALRADGLYDPCGNAIDVLYRIIPLHLPIVAALLPLIVHGRLAVINPPFSCVLENKALQAVVWNLYEADQYFDARVRTLIERYMLPTYLDLPQGTSPFVAKPAYGAEGDAVILLSRNDHPPRPESEEYPTVYQQYVELPTSMTMTEYGERRLHVVTSCFVVAGTPSGICMRAGEAVTNDLAWVLPVCVDGA